MPQPVKVIISPYEHPSEIQVAQWLDAPGRIESTQLKLPPQIFHQDWEHHESEIENQLKAIVKEKGWNYLLVISEVCYANGMIIPVERVMELFRKIKVEDDEIEISFLIDASHSVGNYEGSFGDGNLKLESRDAYVFGSHKWLLSPEPCGVLITANGANEHSKKPYDIWRDELPATTVGLARIGSFVSSLELILKEDRYANFMSLSKLMKEEFIKSVEDKFSVVGNSSNQRLSNMIAIKPKDGYQWIKLHEDELQACLSRVGVNCKVIDKGDDTLWVRLTFLYFITYSDIKQLKSKLEASIRQY
jgi:selenocysteine lyase/cysteine desulfurase